MMAGGIGGSYSRRARLFLAPKYFPSLAHSQRARLYNRDLPDSLPVGPWEGATLTPVTAANP
jgi:hypothetical protein